MSALRMEHQVARLRAGQEPDDLIAPSQLTPLTRRSLKDAFRTVAQVQRGHRAAARALRALTRLS